jgi:hypothetical protein
VIVEIVPPPIGEMTSSLDPMPENHASFAPAICLNCHAEGGEDIPKIPEGHAEFDPEGCLTCHTTQ